jgi:uncharacterized glyoxalase superfamily protein PhnB
MSTAPTSPPRTGERAQPESFRARDLAASLTVNDIGLSMKWYCEVAGFTVDQKYEREGKLMAVSLKAGDVRILLTQDDGAKGPERIKGEGFSLRFTTGQDVDGIARRIKESGGTLESEPATLWGARMFRLRDPDGFKLVISSQQ